MGSPDWARRRWARASSLSSVFQFVLCEKRMNPIRRRGKGELLEQALRGPVVHNRQRRAEAH